VTDSHGNPVAGVNVAWRIVSGSGSLSADHSSTNTSGEASVNFTSDGHAGTTLITASIGGSSVQFTVVVDVGAPAQMSIAGGSGQTGVVGSALKDELSVLVTDAHANPIPGVAVTFAAATNSGSVGANGSTQTVNTDANGIAHTAWHLGGSAGAQSVSVSSSGLTTLSFAATAVAGAASQIVVAPGSSNQSAPSGTSVAVAPSVHVMDSFGNPVVGATVTFTPREGSGSVSASSSPTDANGAASAGGWTLGTAAGVQTLDVSVGAVAAAISATALPTLTIAASGRGSGTVTSQPAGVSCVLTSGAASGPCSFLPAFDAVVTLTAANAANSTFDGFGGVCAGKNPCSVRMSQSFTITASFSRVQRTLTIAGGGSGNGTITSTPAGITCAISNGTAATTGCMAHFEDGTTVTLSERPNGGFKLTSWGNACPVASSCVLSMTLDQAATATFSLGSWTAMSIPSSPLLHGIWGSSTKQVFAVGSAGTILRFDGSTWTSMSGDAVRSNLWDAWGSSASDVHVASEAVAGQGQRLHYDGGAWSVASIPDGVNYYSVWGTSATNVYFGGDYGTFLHFDGDAMSPIETGTRSPLLGIWGSSANDVYAVGLNGTALHYDGQSVKAFTLPGLATEPFTESLGAVWGSSANDLWIGGGDSSGDLWHWDGTSWSRLTLWNAPGAVGIGVNGIWGTSNSDVWAVGANHAYHYDGVKWTAADLPTAGSTTLIRVWGCGPLDVFAAGVSNGAGLILRYQ
ncbi:MAG TPA: Ig-like domain-containing protein, partial [Gemmatimonadaceae bacterium]|nr:Ig-like domain-containing protein [Gemmatimonadaceae bacterium]